jgi:hypothetical protein
MLSSIATVAFGSRNGPYSPNRERHCSQTTLYFQDEHWGQMLRYCVDHGGYTGFELPVLSGHSDPHDDVRVQALASCLSAPSRPGETMLTLEDDGIGHISGTEIPASRVGLYEDPEWPEPS